MHSRTAPLPGLLVVGVLAAVVAALLSASAAGDSSAPLTHAPATILGAAKSPPRKTAGAANIFVSTAGQDGCTRSRRPVRLAQARGHICRTPLRACKLAQSRDVVIVENGRYSNVDFGDCTGHASYAGNVVFRPEPGHRCPMPYPNVPKPWTDTSCDVYFNFTSGEGLIGGSTASCGVSGNPLPSTLTAAQRSSWINHLTIKGIYLDTFEVHCAAYLTLDHDTGTNFYIRQGAYRVTIDGGDYGNQSNGSQPTIGDTSSSSGNWPPAEAITVKNAVIHDFITQGDDHGDGIFVQPSYRVRILKNVLARNDCIPIYVNYATDSGQAIGVHGLRIIGNVVHTATSHNGGQCGQAVSLGNNDQSDTIVAFNSIEGPIRRSNSTELTRNIRIVGNVASKITAAREGNSAGCGPARPAMTTC